MPAGHEAWRDGAWRHDPLVIDLQALTGVDRLCALIGGFHLGDPTSEPVIGPTVAALHELDPSLIVAGHCTGWRAQHALAAPSPSAWLPSSAGSSYRLHAA